jgi:hypothetical protein
MFAQPGCFLGPFSNKESSIPAHGAGLGQINKIYTSQHGSFVTVSTIGLNSALPCCKVDHSFNIDSQTSDVELRGDAYPAIEGYRYRRDGSVQTLLQSADASLDGVASFPQWRDRYEHWTNGVPVSK